MNRNVIITCAVTGSGDGHLKHPAFPTTPAQIAASAIEAAKAGAAVVHLHVRDPETGTPSRDVGLYEETVGLIREAGTDVVINLTAGMGGDLTIGAPDTPADFNPAGTDLVPASDRLDHVRSCRPEICTLDCGTMSFGDSNLLMVNTPPTLRALAGMMKEIGVKPEVEVFDTGHLWMAKVLVEEGLLEKPPLFQFCLGIPYGAEATTTAMKAMVDQLPEGANWSGFGIGRMQMPMVAQAVLLGGNCRVGLEDNLYLTKGQFATNAELVARARVIIEAMGATVAGPAEVRQRWGLRGA